MKIISISGLDGSGKSTQIELLKKHLQKHGKKVYYFHAIQFSLAQKIKEFRNKYCLICKLTGKCKRSSSEDKSVTKANWLQIQLRKIFLLIDILRFRSFAKKTSVDYIISDRYFYDSIINIHYLSGKVGDLFAEKFLIAPNFKFYLDTNPDAIMKRKRVPDQGIAYLKDKKYLYDKYSSFWNMKRIDGNRTQEEVFKEIKNLLKI